MAPVPVKRLAQILPKLERAKKHVLDLDATIEGFLESDPHGIEAKPDTNTGKLVYYLTSVPDIPGEVALMAADAIQNLASCLDHLAYQLVSSRAGDPPPNKGGIYFPIAGSPGSYKTMERRKIEGASRAAVTAIDALKPYKGGNDLFWVLKRLNNFDKHRMLVTASLQLNCMVVYRANGDGGEEFSIPGVITASVDGPNYISEISFHPKAFPFPLKEGLKLIASTGKDDPNPHQKFVFDIAFNEPEVIERKSVRETLHQMVNLVEGVVSSLTPFLK